MKRLFILLATAAAATALCVSCGEGGEGENNDRDNDGDGGKTATLDVTPDVRTIRFTGLGWDAFDGNARITPVFTVTTTLEWSSASDKSWCKTRDDHDDGLFYIDVEENTETTPRGPATVTLTAGELPPVTFTITQDGKTEYDIYIVGRDKNSQNDNDTPVYWKNGLRTELPHSGLALNTFGTCIAAEGADVHIAGTEYVESGRLSVYWKNGGDPIYLTTTGNSTVSDIAADSDGSVLVTGEHDGKPVYWSNSGGTFIQTELSNTSGGEATSICIVGGSIYIGGNHFDEQKNRTAAIWKDGTRMDLPGEEASVAALAFHDGQIYAMGVAYDKDAKREKTVMWRGEEDEITREIIIPQYGSPGEDGYQQPVPVAMAFGYDGFPRFCVYAPTTYPAFIMADNGEEMLGTPDGNPFSRIEATDMVLLDRFTYTSGSVVDTDGVSKAAYWRGGIGYYLSVEGDSAATGISVVYRPAED